MFAAEALPEGRMIDSIVLLGPALSPTYNLAGALAKTRRGILNSYSTKDRGVHSGVGVPHFWDDRSVVYGGGGVAGVSDAGGDGGGEGAV